MRLVSKNGLAQQDLLLSWQEKMATIQTPVLPCQTVSSLSQTVSKFLQAPAFRRYLPHLGPCAIKKYSRQRKDRALPYLRSPTRKEECFPVTRLFFCHGL